MTKLALCSYPRLLGFERLDHVTLGVAGFADHDLSRTGI